MTEFPRKPDVGIVVPTYKTVEYDTWIALAHLIADWPQLLPGRRFRLISAMGSPVDANRNVHVAAALAPIKDPPVADGTHPGFHTHEEVEYLLWCDTDCTANPADFARLVTLMDQSAPDVGIIGACLPIRGPSEVMRMNVMAHPLTGPMQFQRWATGPDFVPLHVSAVGAGIKIVRTSVYRAMLKAGVLWYKFDAAKAPTLREITNADGTSSFELNLGDLVGEDMRFCKEADKFGFRTHAVIINSAGHVFASKRDHNQLLTGMWVEQQRQAQAAQAKAQAQG